MSYAAGSGRQVVANNVHASRPFRFPARSTGSRLVWLLALVFIPLIVAQVFFFTRWYQVQRQNALEANHEFAHAIVLALQGFVRDIWRQEATIGAAITETPAAFSLEDATRHLSISTEGQGAVQNFCWVSPTGRVLASTNPDLVGNEVDDRHYFAAILAGREKVVSGLLPPQVGAQPTFVIARAVRNPHGTLVGVVVATIDVTRLNEDTLAIQRTPGGLFALIDPNGMAVYDSSSPTLIWEARNWPQRYPVTRQAFTEGQPVDGIFPWCADGRQRLVSTASAPTLGWVVSASRDEAVVLGPVHSVLAYGAGVLLLVMLASLVVAVIIARSIAHPLAALRGYAITLGKDLNSRTTLHGSEEVETLADSLNQMAEQLQAQREEVAAQNEELQAQNEELQAQQEELAAQSEELHMQNVQLTTLSQTLEKERAFLEGVVTALPIPVFLIAPDRQVLLANDEARQLMGDQDLANWHSACRILAPYTRALIPLEQWPATRALAGEGEFSLEATVVYPDGREYPTLIEAAPIMADGQVVAAVVMLQDITTLKEEDRAKDEFLAVLSHELLTPITSVLGWSVIAQDDVTDHQLTAQALTIIERNARRQKRLVDDLLDVSRIVHGKLAITFEQTDLWPVAAEQAENLQQAAADRHVTLTVEPPARPLPVEADPARMGQVISNLLNNALKFTETGGAITLTGTQEGGSAVLRVRDTGKGIPREEMLTLFDPFRQLERDETTGGLGLGLALVKGIVELHGGIVEVYSPGVGQGSTFTVRIPLRTMTASVTTCGTDADAEC